MSTKIYTGFRFKTDDLWEVHRIIQRFRHQIEPIAKDDVARLVAATAISLHCRV